MTKVIPKQNHIIQVSKGRNVIGPDIKTVGRICHVEYRDPCPEAGTMAPYFLPMLIEIKCQTPPEIGEIKPTSLTRAELHVPEGQASVYAEHPQWGKAAVIISADGTIIDNFAKKFARHSEKWKGNEKQKKLSNFSLQAHQMMAKKALANFTYSHSQYEDRIHFIVELSFASLRFDVTPQTDLSFWATLQKEILSKP